MSVPRVELQLHDRGALDRLRLDVLDAGDIEEVILVVVRQVAFHLRRVHSAVRLRDVDRRYSERRKNIARHALQREQGAEHDGDHGDDHGRRAAKGDLDEIHDGAPES